MQVQRAISITGKTPEEYQAILTKMEAERTQVDGWELIKEPEKFRVTAEKFEEVDAI